MPVLLGDVARVQIGPEMRRGIAELNGEGEVAGGIVVMRSGKNALETIDAVKAKLAALEAQPAAGRRDRADLRPLAADRARHRQPRTTSCSRNSSSWRWSASSSCCTCVRRSWRSYRCRSASSIAFIVMRHQGVNANIMSLGGIAIAIGAMVDAAIVMIENAHKHIERWQRAPSGAEPDAGATRWRLISDAAVEVGPALFFSLLIITLSFLPVFTLEAQEGTLFAPLAFTKTYAMAAAAALSVTLVPVLMGCFIRGRIPHGARQSGEPRVIASYRPLLEKRAAPSDE